MANDRWPGPGDAARSREEAAPEPGGPGEESLEALRAERDARAREAADLQDRYLRTLADFENFRRRTGREREDWRRQAQEALLQEILPVLDNFDRALAAPPTPGTDQAFRAGVELIHRNFLGALERVGVRPFTAVGQPFDPTRHEAVGRVEQDDVDDQTVIAETLRGYLLQDRVLRPAQVVVAVRPAAASAGGEGAA
ncbi:MAG TPA: nucleotide exchange factor GrpE [Gemmatimonadota bacterium]|jgi:molecular chaperone GrpE|nr:nucleotide exchange factor GrpE [Gemmatimonadota bacterium]